MKRTAGNFFEDPAKMALTVATQNATILLPQIFKAVEKAKENAQPVTMGSASGCSFVGINRREITEDNNVKLCLFNKRKPETAV